ncbi:hypothetical protein LRAMOSA01596 [Lichtheimia ramosa]|uniref:EF-hand domain-containing protein n=1 Tax=Lichtheimia ramosa TaxID=688394 RepID=A0A077WM07_9FUNG|nr:hypothetical protein LRAMOSA01596 [Lichtheimia ramosa]
MAVTIESLPSKVYEHLANALEPRDMVMLASTSKTLYQSLFNNQIWKTKTAHDFGDLFNIYNLITVGAGLELAPDLAPKFGQEPSDWRAYYIQKHGSIDDADTDALVSQAEKEYTEAQAYLKTFQKDGNVVVLGRVASKMIWILDVFPTHAGCYYVLGFILFVLNRLQDALVPLQVGRRVDPNFEPLEELEDEITRILSGYTGNQHEASLLQNDSLSPELTDALSEIFDTFDKDKDGALRAEELGKFILETNGSRPPPQFLRQMGQRFGCNGRGWLTKAGFLAFYLEQTLDDPSETRNDLAVHGYDPHSLKKRMEE